MEISIQGTPEPKEKLEVLEPKSTTPKIDTYMKFKMPSEKSPNKQATTEKYQQKTPVKLDVLMETAMQSWSDNSQNDIIKPAIDKPFEVIEIEDSEDLKLVYEDTECSSHLPREAESPETKAVSKAENTRSEKSPERKEVPAQEVKALPTLSLVGPAQPARPAPRRVSFVTLSSPKNKKC